MALLSYHASVAPGKAMPVGWLVSLPHFGPDGKISTAFEWISTNLCTDIHGPNRMNPNGFGEPMTFPLAPPAGQSFNL